MGIYYGDKIYAIKYLKFNEETEFFDLIFEVDTSDWTDETFIEKYEEVVKQNNLAPYASSKDCRIMTKHETICTLEYDSTDTSVHYGWMSSSYDFIIKSRADKNYGKIFNVY